MNDLRYSKEHEWILVEGDVATIGISDYAQEQLGDVVFVELPEIGDQISQGEEAAVVESVKAASEVFAPVSGEVVETNPELENNPQTVNESPTIDGWFMRVRLHDPSELDDLMDQSAYDDYIGSLC